MTDKIEKKILPNNLKHTSILFMYIKYYLILFVESYAFMQ